MIKTTSYETLITVAYPWGYIVSAKGFKQHASGSTRTEAIAHFLLNERNSTLVGTVLVRLIERKGKGK